MTLLRLFTVLALGTNAFAQAQVHVVDSTGAGEFTTIAAAFFRDATTRRFITSEPSALVVVDDAL